MGRLTSTTVWARHARCVAEPDQPGGTTSSPAASSAGEEASDASNHGCPRAPAGRGAGPPTAARTDARPSRGTPARRWAARAGCRCGCPSARAGARGPPRARTRAPQRADVVCGTQSRQQRPAGSRRPGRPRRPTVEAVAGGRPARRRPASGRRVGDAARPAPGPTGRSARSSVVHRRRRRRGRGAALDVLEQQRDPVAVVVRRQQVRPELVPSRAASSAVTSRRNSSGVCRVQLGADRLDERPGAVLADQPGRAAGRHATDLVGGLDDRRAELVGRPRRGRARASAVHGARTPTARGRSPAAPLASHSQQTSPCHRWWSRRWGEVGGTGSSADLKK